MSALFNQTNIAPGTSFATSGAPTSFSTLTVSSIVGIQSLSNTRFTSDSNVTWSPIWLNYRPALAAQGGAVNMILNWDAVDTGANNAIRVGADANSAFITSEWLGNIGAALRIQSVLLDLEGDNETFLRCDSQAGALGSISTGTPFLSASNAMSSIVAPGGQLADMTALFSTLKDVYPACFVP